MFHYMLRAEFATLVSFKKSRRVLPLPCLSPFSPLTYIFFLGWVVGKVITRRSRLEMTLVVAGLLPKIQVATY